MTATTVRLSRPGWGNPADLQAAQLACDWDVAGAGSCSFVTSREALHAIGITDAKGAWCIYEHPSQGRWSGVITDQRANTDASLSLTATSLHWLLSAKRTARKEHTGHLPAGALAQIAIRDTAVDTTLWLDTIEADEDGALFSQDWRGDDLVDVLDRLASTTGQEWDVTVADDGAITFLWRVRLGRDRTGTVLLREGIELADVEVTESIATIVNDMLGASDSDEWPDAASAVAEDPDSISAYGRRQDTQTYLGADPESLEAYAAADVAVLAQPVRAFRGTIPASHPVANEVRHGDIVGVWLRAANYAGTLRVTNRAVDIDAGTIALAGELGVTP